MTRIEDLNIYIVEKNPYSAQAAKDIFKGFTNISVHHADIRDFFAKFYGKFDCVVSPANAFGRMTGGYDAALSDIFTWNYQKNVQKYIRDHFYGEQVVGSSFIIDTPIEGVKLIHTPTMRYPSKIVDERIIYQCMRSTLICALENNVESIVIPLFGVACGEVNPYDACSLMKEAYEQIVNKNGPKYEF